MKNNEKMNPHSVAQLENAIGAVLKKNLTINDSLAEIMQLIQQSKTLSVEADIDQVLDVLGIEKLKPSGIFQFGDHIFFLAESEKSVKDIPFAIFRSGHEHYKGIVQRVLGIGGMF